MKTKNFTEIKNKTISDLRKLVVQKKSEAINKKMEILSGKEKNLKIYRHLRQEIAKILTLIREKEIIESLEKKGDKF